MTDTGVMLWVVRGIFWLVGFCGDTVGRRLRDVEVHGAASARTVREARTSIRGGDLESSPTS